MTLDETQQRALEHAVFDGIRDGIKAKLTANYNNPLDGLIEKVVQKNAPTIESILDNAIRSLVTTQEFAQEIANAATQNLAKLLIQRFGGEIEKRVNALKSDPVTRARITTAIEDIVRSASSK